MTSIAPPQYTEHEDSPTSELVIAARAAVDEFSSKLASESRLTDERQVLLCLLSVHTYNPWVHPGPGIWTVKLN